VVTEFGLLGEVEVRVDGRAVDLGHARQRCVLAVLLVEANHTVSADQLLDRVWGDRPPERAHGTLRTYLSRLRQALAPAGPVITRRPGGYALTVDEAGIDHHRFRRLVARAAAADRDDDALALLDEALALWRGDAFATLDTVWLGGVRSALDQERLAAELDRADIGLRLGHHARLLPELSSRVADHPLDERLAGQLMLALYRCGRQADALDHYERLRRQLAETLGADPGPDLRELHRRLLTADPAVTGPGPAVVTSRRAGVASGSVSIAQLPPTVSSFTGRRAALRELDTLLAARNQAPAVVISAIAGNGGVGKTALALQWSHQVCDQFPDGQLHVNLRGYDPGEPLPPGAVLERFIRALGVEPAAIPPSLDERAALYRSALAGRRMLVVLDNAGTADQVRPLLPGTPDCLVVVTSRDDLTGLVARDGAVRIFLDRMTDTEAVDLLRHVLGAARVDREPAAARTLVGLCAGLPLALRVAAERAARRPGAPLSDLVAELSDRAHRLDVLSAADDPYTAVRSVLSWSYRGLPAAAARLFRLLGLHPGHEYDEYAAARLAAISLTEAGRLLDVLLSGHLVERTATGRFHMHDLLRAYAAELAAAEDSDADRTAAQTGLLDHYLGGAALAMDLAVPNERSRRPRVTTSVEPIPPMATAAEAMSWLDTERANLVAATGHAARHGFTGYTTPLSATLWRYFDVGAHHTDASIVHTHALRAAAERGDLSGQANALTNLATGHERQGRYDEARDHLERALRLTREADDRYGEFRAVNSLGIVRWRLGNAGASLDLHRRALALARELGDRSSEAAVLGNLGATYENMGRFEDALPYHRQALLLARAANHRSSEVTTLVNLGAAYQGLGRYEEAGRHYRECLELAREGGNRGIEVAALTGLGDALRLAGEPARALEPYRRALTLAGEISERQKQAKAHAGLGHALHAMTPGAPDAIDHWRQALEIFTDLGSTEAADLREHLAKCRGQESPGAARGCRGRGCSGPRRCSQCGRR
jgi:DNA-binding SARP family transcriptional activator/tetratricopeptide (TPR) repeat protein